MNNLFKINILSLFKMNIFVHMQFGSPNSLRWIFGWQFTKILVKGCHVFPWFLGCFIATSSLVSPNMNISLSFENSPKRDFTVFNNANGNWNELSSIAWTSFTFSKQLTVLEWDFTVRKWSILQGCAGWRFGNPPYVQVFATMCTWMITIGL